MKDKWEELLAEVKNRIVICRVAYNDRYASDDERAYFKGSIEKLEWVAEWVRRFLATYP